MLIGRGESVEDAIRRVGTVEGYLAARAAYKLAQRYEVEMPIVQYCYLTCYEGFDARQAVSELMNRPSGSENEPLWMRIPCG